MLGQELERQGAPRKLTVSLSRSESEVNEAQRLRWKVFAEEMGARLPSREPGIDHDLFDPFCEHLLVRDHASGEVVGTYRILLPSSARRIGSYYSETEFDLVRLAHLRNRLVEVGRSCVHPICFTHETFRYVICFPPITRSAPFSRESYALLCKVDFPKVNRK